MKSKVIYMDGIATAHLRENGSVRIELEAGQAIEHVTTAIYGAVRALERSLPAQASTAVRRLEIAGDSGSVAGALGDRAS